MGIFLISCISAINITAGETYSIILNEQYSYYEIIGNQTEVDVGVQQNGNNVTISFGKYVDDVFTITFYNEKEEIILPQQSGGGSSYTKKKVVVNETEEIEEIEDEIEEEEIIYHEELTEEEKNKLLKILILIFIGTLILVGTLTIIKKKDKNDN